MRTVYATTLEVRAAEDITDAINYVGHWIQDWYRRQRLSVDINEKLNAGDLDLAPAEDHRLLVNHYSSTGGHRLTDLRWEYPDPYDTTLAWVIQISLLRATESLLISLDLAVAGVGPTLLPATFKLGSPRVIRDISRLPSVFLGGHTYNLTPEFIGAGEVELLGAELLDKSRPYPIVVVSRRVDNDTPLIDAADLAERLAGVAKVYELIDKWAAFRLTEEVGKPLSCFAGAVRLYWPRFALGADPYAHPNWMPWHLADPAGVEESLRHLCELVFEASAFRQGQPSGVVNARQAAQREAREKLREQNTKSVDDLLDAQIELEQKLETAEAQVADLARENEILRANAQALAVHGNRAAPIPSAETHGSEPEAYVPTSIAGAVSESERVSRNLIFLTSAHEAASESPFRHAERVLEALAAIDEVAGVWRESISSGKSVGALRQLFKKKGFDYADDVSQTSKTKWGAQYSAVHEGREIDISPHITIGAKQADSCISIHWGWDRESRKAIVAHVGRHKTNTKT